MSSGDGRVVPEHHSHAPDSHRDVTGGWLRPAVFGVMDGLVSNTALIAGVAGSGLAPRAVALTGLAGLVARGRQLLLGAAATGLTYAVGSAVGAGL